MKKVNLFFLAIIFALNLAILPFSAIAAETADDESLADVARNLLIKKCKGNIDEDKFSKFIKYLKYMESGTIICYDCKKGMILQGQIGRCKLKVSKDAPNYYILK